MEEFKTFERGWRVVVWNSVIVVYEVRYVLKEGRSHRSCETRSAGHETYVKVVCETTVQLQALQYPECS